MKITIFVGLLAALRVRAGFTGAQSCIQKKCPDSPLDIESDCGKKCFKDNGLEEELKNTLECLDVCEEGSVLKLVDCSLDCYKLLKIENGNNSTDSNSNSTKKNNASFSKDPTCVVASVSIISVLLYSLI
ncbi:hypothetical protein BB559_001380 [Furculomyces boomerangus]|uniref:Extracellular membrane protein CFEM domain-containing protein n=2 Tax=Harpellales TaxID=61421 RepID=A0A2T9Z232_9FUNG|nr:hypothetical protein BB559_001380 [Furculomyces boomerangus]PVZ98538.1 hypothetical protein BB558_005443 [Smittium angustum]PWA02136.1 hypothetical protein BB558_001721 [Smittium angustum]